MIKAVVYTSNSGYTKEYAELLAGELGVKAYSTKGSIPSDLNGADIAYLGWVMAGGIAGYKKITTKYNAVVVCSVGMSPLDETLENNIRNANNITSKLFCLQGGFDINRLHGINKLLMKMMSKKILGDIAKKESLNETDIFMKKMVLEGASCVSKENIAPVVAYCKSL